MQAVLPRPDVAPTLQAEYVALAADADEPEPAVHGLLSNLRNAMMLPIVLLAGSDGTFLAGAAGSIDAARLRKLLEEAEEKAG